MSYQFQWTVRPVSPKHLKVCAGSLDEERAFRVLFEACAASPDVNVWEAPATAEVDAKTVLGGGMPAMDLVKYRDPVTQQIMPIPRLLAGLPTDLEADAVAGDGFRVSYGELFKRVDVVYRAVLSAASPGRAKAAIVYMPRGEAIAPAFLGVLKAGFHIIPVDVHWPADRPVAVAEDSEAAVALVEPSSAAAWHAFGLNLPVITVDAPLFQGGDGTRKCAILDQEDPAMILFTSGLPVEPKGIVLS